MDQRQWANLPTELLEIIGKRLDSRLDVIRFRSVCTSWRSFPLLFDKTPPSVLLLNLPYPILTKASLSESTVYGLEPLVKNSNSSIPSPSFWMIRVEEKEDGEMQLLNPLSYRRISTKSSDIRFNLLDFRMVELSKAYALKYFGFKHHFGVNKVVLLSDSAGNKSDELAILAIYHEGKLGYWKNGDKSWTLLDDRNFEYDDIILYKGQLYVVDRSGTVSWIDSSLSLIQYSPPLYGCGSQKNLVVSGGDLFVVDRYLDGERRRWHLTGIANNDFYVRPHPFHHPEAVDFRVYKLDEEWGRWVDIRSLGDRAFVLGNDCSFSVSAGEFSGCRGNCIFFTDQNGDDLGGHQLSNTSFRAFSLEDHSIRTKESIIGFSEIIWPPQLAKPKTSVSF